MRLKHTLLLAAAFSSLTTFAQQKNEDAWQKWGPQNSHNAGFVVRAGYTIGGTSPIPLPQEIRHINEFSPKGGGNLGIDAYRMFSKRWGASAGVHFFYQGFHTSADVKNYKMQIKMGEDEMGGYFTGCDVTNTYMVGANLSLLATCRVSPRWNISVGPFLATYFKKDFSGEVYDNKQGVGYLRVDSPTGEKVIMSRESPATYDFSDDMRNLNGGVEFVFDWKAMSHFDVFAMLDWGLSDIFRTEFKETVPFKIYPIYATLGVAYRY